MEIPILKDIIIIFGLSVLVVFACHKIKLPTIVGYLITGVIAGPHGLGLIQAQHEVEYMAEMGVVLLLFTIGMEFSFRDLLTMKRTLLIGGSTQVFLTVLAAGLAALYFGRPSNTALFWGYVMALSSTAIVLKLLQEQAALDSPGGRLILAILIFQDIVVVLMILTLPLLAQASAQAGSGWLLAAKGAGAVLVLAATAKWIAPRALSLVVSTRNRELFLIFVVLLCLAVAWLTNAAGLSLALGAFVAGLIISESPYSHQAIGSVLPMKDIFTSLFFVSIGMLLDLSYLIAHPLSVLALGGAVVAGKIIFAGLAGLVLRYPFRVALQAGLSLCQIGEFSFILSRLGLDYNLMAMDNYQLFLSTSVVTMAVAPAFIHLGLKTASGVRTIGKAVSKKSESDHALQDHIIIIGFGINGRNVARAAKASGIPYVILEMNHETVRREKNNGEAIHYGDAINQGVLEHIGLLRAKVLVITIADPVAARRITSVVKAIHPGLYVIARTRYLSELESLYELGADEVIPEEYETAVEIFARVLRRYFVPQPDIDRLVAELRSEGYEMLRGIGPDRGVACEVPPVFQDARMVTVRISPGSPADGQRLSDLDLRRVHGLTVLAITRGREIVSNPPAEMRFESGDLAVLFGRPDRIAGGLTVFSLAEAQAPLSPPPADD